MNLFKMNPFNMLKTLFHSADFYKENIATRDAVGKMSDRITAIEKKIGELMHIATEIKEKAVFQPQNQALDFDKALSCYKDESGHLLCPSCYDDKQKRIKLIPILSGSGWQCHVCKNVIKNPSYNPPPPPDTAPQRPWRF